MIDLSSFSGMFPSLSSFFGQQGLDVSTPDRTQDSAQNATTQAVEQDSVQLTDSGRRPIPSGLSSATFDASGKPEPISVAEDGTYHPTVQTTKRLGLSFSFEFSLNIERQVTAVAREPRTIDRDAPSSVAPSSAARLSVLESRSLYYQSILNESSGLVAGGYAESRTLQTELFYSRTRELSMSVPALRAEQFDQTRAQVTRSFQMNISMDFSFLAQFTRQSGTISSLDDDLFGRYLGNTGGLSAHSAEAVQAFFNDVDRILEESETFVVPSLASFFDQVAEQFGLNAEEAGNLEEMVMDEVASFFDDVDRFLSESRAALTGPVEPAMPVDTTTPAVGPPEAEDPAALLA